MKKFLISAITLTLALSSCSSDSTQNDATEELHATTRNCYSTEHLANQIAADPSLAYTHATSRGIYKTSIKGS